MAFAPRAFIAATLLSLAPVLWAAPGALDTSFGSSGAVAAAAGGVNAIAIRPDGKVLAAGWTGSGFSSSNALMSYNADGSVDTSFGSGGAVGTSMTNNAMAVQPDGKVVIAGGAIVGYNNAIVLERHNADGSLDTSFGSSGVVITSSGDIEAHAVALQPDGKVVVTGIYSTGEFFVVRYNADGSLDTGFGTKGVATAPSRNGGDQGWAIAVQPDGKVVVAGKSLNSNGRYDMALVRFNANGALDTAFGSGGTVIIQPSWYDSAFTAIALQFDGKILAAGFSYDMGYKLARFNTDGSVDTSFGSSGFAGAPGTGYTGTSIALQPDGKVLAIGSTYNGTTYGVTLMRFDANGGLDSSFGTSGLVTGAGVAGAAIAIQPDGKLVAGGYETGTGNLVVKRYIASDTTWGLTPGAVAFTDQNGVALRSTVTSDTVTVSGLDTGLEVPLQISGGSYSLNGGAYTSAMGWVKNGDTITVRQTASSKVSTATVATLTLGGLVAPNTTSTPLGTTTSATFTSTTTATAPDSGGGAFNLASLLLLGFFGARRRANASV